MNQQLTTTKKPGAHGPAASSTRPGFGDWASKNRSILAPVGALIVMIIGFTIMSPEFLTVGNAVNILLDSSVLMILALASTIIILMGSIDLSIGSTLAICAFTGALLAQSTGDNNLLLLVPIVGLICGLLNGLGVAFLGLPSFLVTLGSFFVYNGLANYFSGGQPVTLMAGGPLDRFSGTIGGVPVIALWAVVILGDCPPGVPLHAGRPVRVCHRRQRKDCPLGRGSRPPGEGVGICRSRDARWNRRASAARKVAEREPGYGRAGTRSPQSLRSSWAVLHSRAASAGRCGR